MFTSWAVLLQCNGCRSFVFHMVRKRVLLKVCFPATLVLHGINSPHYIKKKKYGSVLKCKAFVLLGTLLRASHTPVCSIICFSTEYFL